MSATDHDAELMLRVKQGDRTAFRELVELHQRSVIQTINRSIGDAWEAEDLAQRAFVQVWRSASRYEPRAKFTTWLFTIVRNVILNEYRRRGRRSAESLDAMGESSEDGGTGTQFADTQSPDPSQHAVESELQERIAAVVQELPENQRLAVILCRFEGHSYEEIAETLGCSVPSVKSLLHRARETLKEKLRGFY